MTEEERAAAVRKAAAEHDAPDDMADWLVVQGVPYEAAVEAIENYAEAGWWRSPDGTVRWGSPDAEAQ